MDYCVLENLHWKIEMEPVLKTMDCYEDSPVYEEVVEEYEENLEDMKKLVKPWASWEWESFPMLLPQKNIRMEHR